MRGLQSRFSAALASALLVSGTFQVPERRDTVTVVAPTTASADEHAGHVMGSMSRTADSAAAVLRVERAQRPTPVSVTARWALFCGLFVLFGAVVFRLLIVGRLHVRDGAPLPTDLDDAARNAALIGSALLLIALVSRVFTEGGALASDVTVASLLAIIVGTTWGIAWIVSVAGVTLSVAGIAFARSGGMMGWRLAAVGGLTIAGGIALASHASDVNSPALAVFIGAMHLAGAAGWLGTLSVLLLWAIPVALHGEESHARVASLVATFSPVALGCAGLAALTGVWTALLHVGSISALTGSNYGRTLLVKLGVLALVATLGYFNWRIASPKLGGAQGTARLTRSASMEIALGAVVLLISAVLVATSPE